MGTLCPSVQNVEDSKAFFKRKIEFLTKQIEKIQPVLQEKHAMKQGKPSYIFFREDQLSKLQIFSILAVA